MSQKLRYVLQAVVCTALIGLLFFIGTLTSEFFNDIVHENMAAVVVISVVFPAVTMYLKYDSEKQK
ncbi:hypothetical protein J2S36_000989 [Arcanobacterium hippocoleae]|uniref:Uncharacterized protein n=1 Tax=Arcanobacterium hippocoleae TaxID=149017 RepID=A0ABU1SZE2_9ACTO|nr:hypothetical protein [Arcanobacterium hippocoleae]MDR6939446.1 hypothetical protein [Arcanobacterium hippocoleae]